MSKDGWGEGGSGDGMVQGEGGWQEVAPVQRHQEAGQQEERHQGEGQGAGQQEVAPAHRHPSLRHGCQSEMRQKQLM
jgi:hypothetical protein